MSSSVFDHYNRHLGPIYAWMVGDFDAAAEQMATYFESVDLQPFESSTAVDLGCGHGLQAIPLAKRGFNVIAIDNCEQLLESLGSRISDLTVQTIHDDLRVFENHMSTPVDAIVCMGDTLTHLDSVDDVTSLVGSISRSLNPGGAFCTSFRDYASTELIGLSRFIPVRSDDERIHTCFLEYDSDVVHVHDLIHTRQSDGWTLSTSVYDKIRLAPSLLKEVAQQHDLELVHESTEQGMGYYTFRRRDDS